MNGHQKECVSSAERFIPGCVRISIVFQGHAQWSGEWQSPERKSKWCQTTAFSLTHPPQTAQLTCPHPRNTPQVGGKPLPTPVPLNARGYKWRCERGESNSEGDRTTEMDPMARHGTLMFLMACLLWTTCSAAPMQCHFNSQALCEYDGKQYSMGESWMEQGCVQCTCLHPVGVGCCETVLRPVDFPSWCEVRVESLTCQVMLVLTSDPRLPCIPGEDNNVDPRHGALSMKLEG